MIRCSKCGNEVNENEKYCLNCGAPINGFNGIDINKVREYNSNYESANGYASVGKRIGGFIIDWFIISIIFVIMFIVLLNIISVDFDNNTLPSLFAMLFLFLPFIIFTVAQPFANIFKKHTFGMKICNYKIKNDDGSDLSFTKRLIRFIVYVALAFSGVGILVNFTALYVTEKHQSIADIILGTIGINEK